MRSLHSQTATVNLASGATVLSHTVTTATALADLIIEVGDGTNNLAAAAETTLTVAITIDTVPVRGTDPTETVIVGRTRLLIPVDTFPVAAGEVVAVTLTSDKAADTGVAVTATLRDASPLQPVTKGNQALVDADGKVTGTSTYTALVADAAKTALEAEGSSLATLLSRTQFLSAGDAVRVYWPPVGADGNTLFLKAADDYLDRSGTAIPLTVQTVADLNGATLIFGATNRGNQISGTGTVVGLVDGTTDQWNVLVEITRAEMDKPSGEYEYDLDAELAGDGDFTTIQSGTLFLQANRTVRTAA